MPETLDLIVTISLGTFGYMILACSLKIHYYQTKAPDSSYKSNKNSKIDGLPDSGAFPLFVTGFVPL